MGADSSIEQGGKSPYGEKQDRLRATEFRTRPVISIPLGRAFDKRGRASCRHQEKPSILSKNKNGDDGINAQD